MSNLRKDPTAFCKNDEDGKIQPYQEKFLNWLEQKEKAHDERDTANK